MKALTPLLVFLVAFSSTLAQTANRELGLGYTYMGPIGPMQNHIRQGHGFTMEYYFTPDQKRVSYGMELMLTQYGHDRSKQEYTFPNGTVAPMDIVVNNNVTNLLLSARYNLPSESLWRPFIAGKLGYAWFTTNLTIYDPDDFDDCAPIDSEILLRDGTFVLSAGGGVQYDLSGMFKKLNSNRLIFTVNANLILGGMVKYMSTNAPDHYQHNHQSNTDVMARFVNTQTQVVHEHHVGNVYQSMAQMVDLRAGIIFRR
ncbi:MAG: hypothetical protein KF687_07550 [Cyclobacteriaceae bacterium]|nr:hypothetical protein [Cyclobacteriaceae bacterium]